MPGDGRPRRVSQNQATGASIFGQSGLSRIFADERNLVSLVGKPNPGLGHGEQRSFVVN
jgi:hypothetical protein